MSNRRSSSMIIIRPFRIHLSILDLRNSQSSNTNETSTIHSSASTRRSSVQTSNPLMLKLNEFLVEHQNTMINSSSVKTISYSISDRDIRDREIIERFYKSSNEIEARKTLAQMWKESRFCDLMLVVDGSEYLAHRLVLAAFSSKYRKLFRDRRNDFVTRTHLRHSSHKGLQLILNFLYTGELTLTFRNIHEILNCAKELDIAKILEISEEFLMTFEKRHVFHVLELSRRFGMKKAFYQSHDYLSTNFNQCISMKQFLQLPLTTIRHILDDETIENRDESILFGRILNWITTNHLDNHQLIISLFEQIRWNNLDYQEQKEWLTASQELAENPKFASFIRDQINIAYQKSKYHSKSSSKTNNGNMSSNGSHSRQTSRRRSQL